MTRMISVILLVTSMLASCSFERISWYYLFPKNANDVIDVEMGEPEARGYRGDRVPIRYKIVTPLGVLTAKTMFLDQSYGTILEFPATPYLVVSSEDCISVKEKGRVKVHLIAGCLSADDSRDPRRIKLSMGVQESRVEYYLDFELRRSGTFVVIDSL